MPTSPTSGGHGGHTPTLPVSDATPCALDFALLLRARQEMESRAQAYPDELQAQITAALQRRGYQDVQLTLVDGPPLMPNLAGASTLVLLARLPLDGLKSPRFRVQVRLTVTYAGELLMKEAQINTFTVSEPFAQSLEADTAQVAEALIQGLSQRYMDYLLRLGESR